MVIALSGPPAHAASLSEWAHPDPPDPTASVLSGSPPAPGLPASNPTLVTVLTTLSQ